MLTVTISVNGRVIYARTAVNVTHKHTSGFPGEHTYEVDSGGLLYHKPEDGAVVLAKKMLDTIKETK